jgi:hypothetical protein
VRTLKQTKILVVMVVMLSMIQSPAMAAQVIDLGTSNLAGAASPANNQVHALELTRFHFITLKQFHSGLFGGEAEFKAVAAPSAPKQVVLEKTQIKLQDAQLLNKGLNAFLASGDRADVLLGALRENKAIQLKFSISRKTGETEMVTHPRKTLLYRIQPVVTKVPVTIKLRPMLDGPIAFEISLALDGNERFYHVDWAGNIIA